MPREGEARWLAVVEYTSLFDSLVQLFLFNCTVGTEGGGGLDAKGGRGQVVASCRGRRRERCSATSSLSLDQGGGWATAVH